VLFIFDGNRAGLRSDTFAHYCFPGFLKKMSFSNLFKSNARGNLYPSIHAHGANHSGRIVGAVFVCLFIRAASVAAAWA